MAANRAQLIGYDKLYFRIDEIPYLVVRDIRADVLYCDSLSSGLKPREIATDMNLDLESVNQAIRWCREHEDLVTRVLKRERKEAGIKD